MSLTDDETLDGLDNAETGRCRFLSHSNVIVLPPSILQ
jgi:hypothetical protein